MKLEVRGQNASQSLTRVLVGDRKVINITRDVDDSWLKRNLANRRGHRPEWEVKVAERMDLSLVSIPSSGELKAKGQNCFC